MGGVWYLAGGIVILTAYLARRVLLFGWYVPLYTVPIAFGLYRTLLCCPERGLRAGHEWGGGSLHVYVRKDVYAAPP